MGRGDRFSRALVRVNAAEEKQIFAAMGIERKILHRNAMMDRCSVAQIRMPIGLADRHVVVAIFVFLVGWQNALGRETVDGRDHRGPDQPRESERYKIRLVMNKVERTGLLKDMG